MSKPTTVFGRDREWAALARFAATPLPGVALGLLYGRRRQGKTFLAEQLAARTQGVYAAALEQTAAQQRAALSGVYERAAGLPSLAAGDLATTLDRLLDLGRPGVEPVVVVLDELPYLVAQDPSLPSALQALLSPARQAARPGRVALLLCGSAMSVMTQLLTASAPLRGRASLELVLDPFPLPDAAAFWGVADDPELALRLHALVGGTPAYRSMAGGDAPTGARDLDAWVCRTLLEPSSALFREGQVLVASDGDLTDRVTASAILTAVAAGHSRRGQIAQQLGRAEGSLSRPLETLLTTRLLERRDDPLRGRRGSYQVAEPVVRLAQRVVRPQEARLLRGGAAAVWAEQAATVSSGIYGPAFEEAARSWAWGTEPAPAAVGSSEVACREHRVAHELDVVAADDRGFVRLVGEAKWRQRPVGVAELLRLQHVRGLLPAARVEEPPRLLLASRAGFTDELRRAADAAGDVLLVTPADLVRG